jgi:hypothetical protein
MKGTLVRLAHELVGKSPQAGLHGRPSVAGLALVHGPWIRAKHGVDGLEFVLEVARRRTARLLAIQRARARARAIQVALEDGLSQMYLGEAP